MIFKGTPNMLVVDTKTKPHKKYRFNSKGELEITDEKTALRFSKKFPVKRTKKK